MSKILCEKSKANSDSCVSCPQRKVTLINNLESGDVDTLDKDRYSVNYKRGQAIFRSATKPIGLICIHSGKVKIVRNGPAGNDQIVGLHKAGDMIGIRALVKDQNYFTTAFALEDTQVCIIPQEAFIKLLEKDASFCLKIMKHFIDKLEESEKLYLNHSQKHMNGRLADALIQINSIFGCCSETKYLDVSFKRSELAQLANMTTANVIRALSTLASEKIIDIEGRKIRITDMDKLDSISLSGR